MKFFFPVTQNKMHFLGGNVHFTASASLCVMASTGSSSFLLFGSLHLLKGDRVAEIELVASPDM